MGGKLLQNIGARRLSRDEAEHCSAVLLPLIHQVLERLPSAQARVLKSYRNKSSFGDLDIIVTKSSLDAMGDEQFVAALSDSLGFELSWSRPNPKSPMFSIGYPLAAGGIAQVDIVMVEDQSYAFSSCFLDYNGLGKLINLVAKSMGKLKLSHEGFFHPLKVNGVLIGNVELTRNFDEALAFVGYDPSRYHRGFDTADEIFQYASTSPWFSREVFRPENRNAKAANDTKRPFYQDFLSWMDKQDLPETVDMSSIEWVQRAYLAFPEAVARKDEMLKAAQAAKDLNNEFRSKFNGKVIREITGISGVDLGLFMESFKLSTGEADFKAFVLSKSQVEMAQMISKHHVANEALNSNATPQS